jgi:Beta-lactamase class C and other penicillin binding proteins
MRRAPCAVAGAILILSAFVAASPLVAEGQDARRARGQSPAPDIAAIDSFIQRCVDRYRIPGLSFALVEDGATVFSKGYGEASRGRPATADTPYYLGSTAKMFTALAVLRLVEEARVELDAPYKRYVGEFRLAVPGAAERITVRHLLNQTSGLSDRGAVGDSTGGSSLEAELARLRSVVPLSEPGTSFRYYNVNYRLLALLVERVSGRPFGDFVEKEVFAPLGMSSSRARDPRTAGLPEAVAQGHGSFLGLPIERRQEFRSSALASGMMISTARDIASYFEAELAVSEGGAALGPVSAASLEAAWIPPSGVSWPEESLGEGGRYGMGWMVIEDGKGGSFLFHGGALENFQSAFYLDPLHRRGFAILIDQGGIAVQSSLGALRDGLFALLDGREPGNLPGRPPVLVFAILFFLAVAYSSFRMLRLRAWRERSERRAIEAANPRRARMRDLAFAGLELCLALFLVFGLLPLGNAIVGDSVDWAMLYGLAPDAVCALPIILAGALVVAAYKFLVLARRGLSLTKGRGRIENQAWPKRPCS